MKLTEEFSPNHCQRDYSSNSMTLLYEGNYNHEKAVLYILSCYPSWKSFEILEHSEPSEYKGFSNDGCVIYK